MKRKHSTYGIHPSRDLVKLFMRKPYQGQDPQHARVLIVGNDANYSEEIAEHPFFEMILEYHSDGIGFWEKYDKHHPFLLEDYPFDKRKDGVRYHLNFSKMKFTAEDAQYFSFIELLNVPTIGNTGDSKNRFLKMLDLSHLEWLEDLIFNGRKKFVIVNQTLSKEIKRIQKEYGVLCKLYQALNGKNFPSIVLETDHVILYNGYSFAYSVSNTYLYNLGKIIREFIHDT
jgi:hypothetical protein